VKSKRRGNLNNLEWCKDTFENKWCQKCLEEKLTTLIKIYFEDKEEYPIEKFIKSFCEGLGYLEKLMLMQRNIHYSQLNNASFESNKFEIVKKHAEVEKAMLVEFERQFRHYSIFLSALRE
jgi:hypothetical protein